MSDRISDLIASTRELAASGRQLFERTGEVLDRDAKTREELADLRGRVLKIEAERAAERAGAARPISGEFFDLARRSARVQGGVAIAIMVLALAIAGWIWPGITVAIPLIGAGNAP